MAYPTLRDRGAIELRRSLRESTARETMSPMRIAVSSNLSRGRRDLARAVHLATVGLLCALLGGDGFEFLEGTMFVQPRRYFLGARLRF